MEIDLLQNLIQLVLERELDSGHVIIDQDGVIVWYSPSAAKFFQVDMKTGAETHDVFKSITGVNAAITSALSQDNDSSFSLNHGGQELTVQISGLCYQQQTFCHLEIGPTKQIDKDTQQLIASLKQQYAQMVDMTAYVFANRTKHDASLAGLTLWQHKTTRFSSDIVLATKRPGGGVNVFLGNFVGGVIPAAVGALPVAEVFYGMTAKGYGISDIIAEMNNKLQQIMPDDIFCVACMVEIEPEAKILAVWNGGIPDLLIVDKQATIKHRVSPRHIPLGLHRMKKSDLQLQFLETEEGDEAYMLTAGLINAVNNKQQKLGMDKLSRLLIQLDSSTQLQAELEAHIAETPQYADMSLLTLDIHQLAKVDFDTTENTPAHPVPAAYWHANFTFTAEILQQLDLVPLLINIISQIQLPNTHRQRMYTVLAELCTNAIDHGLLQLDSSMKQTPKGFADYYMLRMERMASLQQGQITVELDHKPYKSGGLLSIAVLDSGDGFDVSKLPQATNDGSQFSGRGLTLVRNLCDDLYFNDKGNQVHVSYYWESRAT